MLICYATLEKTTISEFSFFLFMPISGHFKKDSTVCRRLLNETRRKEVAMHALMISPKTRPDICTAIRDAIAKRVPEGVVVVVDELVTSSRITTNQPYVNKDTAYVYLHHGGDYLKDEAATALGIEVTTQFPGFAVVFVLNKVGPWCADGKVV